MNANEQAYVKNLLETIGKNSKFYSLNVDEFNFQGGYDADLTFCLVILNAAHLIQLFSFIYRPEMFKRWIGASLFLIVDGVIAGICFKFLEG